MLAKDVMTKRVVTVNPDTEVQEIAKRLLEAGISAVPVIDSDGTVQGIVSESDLIRRAEIGTEKRLSRWSALILQPEEQAADYLKSHGRLAKDVMTAHVVTVDEDTPVADVAELLERRHIKRVPVVKDGRLVGILSRANLLHSLAVLRPSRKLSADDDVIRDHILEALDLEVGISAATVSVVVDSGVVHLWGAVGSEEQRRAVVVCAETTTGVKSVDNHLGVVPPYIGLGV